MRIKNGLVSFAGIAFGIFGVVGPIAWDYYKTKSEIEVRVIERSVIVSRPEKLEGLLITYRGEPLEELSKAVISISNTGRTPISKKDIAVPISVVFPKESGVLDAKLEATQPSDLGASLIFHRDNTLVTVDFPLLNPGDRVDFSVLARASTINFVAAGRVAGVSSLKVEKDVSQDKYTRSISWTIYPIGLFSALLAITALVGFFKFPKERRIKLQVKQGTFELPNLTTREEWLSWTNTTFGFTTPAERESLRVLFRTLPEADNFSSLHREEIMSTIRQTLDSAASNLVMGIIVLSIASAGVSYIYMNL